MLNQHAVDQSHVASQPAFFPLFPDPEGMLSRFFGVPSSKEGLSCIWDTHGTSGHFLQIQRRLLQHLIRKSQIHGSLMYQQSQTPTQDQRCQSGPSARNSFVLSEGRSSKNYGANQQRLQISIFHFDNLPTPATFACWKIRFKTEVCTCSQFPTEAILWIKEVEMVELVDDLKSSSSIRGISMPDSEVLDARIASALHKIIHNSHFKRRISLEE